MKYAFPILAVCLVAGASTGCGLEEAGQAKDDAGAPRTDASTGDATVLPDADQDVFIPPPPMDAGCKDTGPCTGAIPTGWKLVIAPPTTATACPTTYPLRDYITGVTTNPNDGTCGCSACNVTASPACDDGTVSTGLSASQVGNCGNTGTTFTFPGCQPVNNPGGLASYIKAPMLGPTKGTCATNVLTDKSKATKAVRRTCEAPAACAEDLCQNGAPGWQVCITGPGPTCPSGFTVKQDAFDDFDVSCASCSCDVNGPSTCTGAVVRYYNESTCTTERGSVVADSKCNSTTGSGNQVGWAKYTATLNVACTVTGTKVANVVPKAPSTICCK